MNRSGFAVEDRQLERHGRRMVHPALRFLGTAAAIALVGIVILVIDAGWSLGVGIAVLLIASIPAVVGVGLLNKHSMAFFVAGLGGGLLLTPSRRWLFDRRAWIAAAIAALIAAPHVWWQISNGWPPVTRRASDRSRC